MSSTEDLLKQITVKFTTGDTDTLEMPSSNDMLKQIATTTSNEEILKQVATKLTEAKQTTKATKLSEENVFKQLAAKLMQQGEQKVMPIPDLTELLQASPRSSSNSNNRSPVDLEETKTMQECYDDIKEFEILRADIKKIQEMNLIDDEDYLYTLYMKQPGLSSPNYLYSLIVRLYCDKYSELFDAYPSLRVFLMFVTSFLCLRSEEELKRACGINAHVNIGGRHASFTTMSLNTMKRRLNFDNCEYKATPEKKAKSTHPFLNSSEFHRWRPLFEIGTMTKYILPSEFAILNCSLTKSQVRSYGRQNDHSDTTGLRGNLKIPIIVSLKTRTNQNYNFASFSSMGAIEKLITLMTSINADEEPNTFGSKMNMRICDVRDGSSKIADKNFNFSTDNYVTVLHNFSCTFNSGGSFSFRAYSDKVNHIPNTFTDMTDEEVREIDGIIERESERRTTDIVDFLKNGV
jgi:hypothetical protein